MGRNNQERRAEKKRRDERQSRGGRRVPGATAWLAGDVQARRVESLVFAGMSAAAGASAQVAAAAEGLALCARESTAPTAVTALVGALFSRLLAQRWEEGWQPLELARFARRRRSNRHAELVATGMSAAECWDAARGAGMPEAWSAQLAALATPSIGRPGHDWLAAWTAAEGASDSTFLDSMVVALEAFGALLALPPIEPILRRPSEWSLPAAGVGRDTADDPVLTKVRALLAKAESTSFEAESEALTAKAQELMARHAIEKAVARFKVPRRELPVTRRIAVDDPYASAKSQLLAVVARANDVRCVWYEDFAMMAVVGFAADLEAVETLFTSLLLQASKAMLARGKVSDGLGRSRTRSFRQSFIVAFAIRIGERLTAATAAAQVQAEQEMATSLAPVLASRAREIDDEVARVFPHTRRASGPSVTNGDGWHAGRLAAEMATLGPQSGVLAGASASH